MEISTEKSKVVATVNAQQLEMHEHEVRMFRVRDESRDQGVQRHREEHRH